MSLLGNILLSAVAGIVESANKEPSPEEIKREQALREFEKGVPFYKLPEHDEDAALPQKRKLFARRPTLRTDIPPIDIRTEIRTNFWGKRVEVDLSRRQQRRIKRELEPYYPDRYFLDDLNDWNTYITVEERRQNDQAAWEALEEAEAAFKRFHKDD